MTDNSTNTLSRRALGKHAAGIAAAGTLAAMSVPNVYAAAGDTIQLALIGCGGRGSGAAVDALSTRSGPIKLVAMADAYPRRLTTSFGNLSTQVGAKMDVPPERRFVGFDAYKKAMDCLKPGDVAIFATPLAFRWVHFQYAIEKGLNVFMEKPLTSDGVTSKRMFKLAEEATAKNLKVGVGLMTRHARPFEELQKRIQDGEIGEIIMMRGYRMGGGGAALLPKPPNISDLDYQVQKFHSMIWAGGGVFSDYNIHIIDHLCWLKNAWPVKVQALGGRHYKTDATGVQFMDQNFDTYSAEYTFADGAKMLFDGRCIVGTFGIYSSYVHGTKGMAVASRNGDCGRPSITYKGQTEVRENRLWQSTDNSNPYQNEWNDLIDAIRKNQPYNEVKRGVEASLVTSMGRMAAHTGQEITYDMMLNSDHEFAPGLDTLTSASPAPVQPGPDGRYPGPMPGIKKREY
jgi:predicted dehydrogenase